MGQMGRRGEVRGWRMRRSAAILATMSAVGSVSAFGFVTALLAPEAPSTKALGTNGSGIVGEFTDNTGTQGFIDSGGNVIVLDVPGASSTEVLGIDSMGDVVGVFADTTGTTGFLGVGGLLRCSLSRTCPIPSWSASAAQGIRPGCTASLMRAAV